MSRQHTRMFADRLAAAFLFGDENRSEVAEAAVLRTRWKHVRATSITTTETEAPVDTRWVDRRAMKRAR